jgi:hypothetical protein
MCLIGRTAPHAKDCLQWQDCLSSRSVNKSPDVASA